MISSIVLSIFSRGVHAAVETVLILNRELTWYAKKVWVDAVCVGGVLLHQLQFRFAAVQVCHDAQ